MRSQVRGIILFIAIFMVCCDALVFAGLQGDFSWPSGTLSILGFWSLPLIFLLVLVILSRRFAPLTNPAFFASFFIFASFFMSVYIPKLLFAVFTLTEYILKLAFYPAYMLLIKNHIPFGEFIAGGPLNFFTWIAIPLCIATFVAMIAGMAFGRFNYKVRREEINLRGLPPGFEGLKIVHISDLHLGSMYGKQEKLARAIELINRENAGLILFTGDLVNNLANEAEGWTGLLSTMRSRFGTYSILGNHDYGDHYRFEDESERQANLDRLIEAHRQSGFTPLLNQSAVIHSTPSANPAKPAGENHSGTDESGSRISEIYIAGVENWGEPPFKQYGDLDKALGEIPADGFIILLSHDPSHWDAEVIKKTDVALTLSGHTHGMQFGIRTKKFRWSPIQLKYPRWIGLYRQGEQFLHVTPGLGYIGYAGRILIPPEISVLTLHRKDERDVEK